MLGSPATSKSNGYSHRGVSSVSSVDLDIEGGGRIDESYDTGLPWPLGKSAAGTPWSAKGPAAHVPRLSVGQSAKCHLSWSRSGWQDANRWPDALRLISSSTEIRNGVLKGLLLCGTISVVVFFFELAFFPKVLFQQSARAAHDIVESGSIVGSLGNVFWLYPLIGGSYLLASSWTSDIAQATFKLRHGHLKNLSLSNNSIPPGTSRRLLQESYRVLLILNYIAIYFVLVQIPYIGRILAFLFMSMVDGYYCFEQVWISRGWSLEKRMRYCEERWSYFVAFGLPSTAVSFFHPSGLLNLMLFMLVFPFCTVLAMMAHPQPRLSASGSATTTPDYSVSAGSDSAPLSRLLPTRIPIFWPTIKLHKLLLKTLPNLAAVTHSASVQAYERSSFGRLNGGGQGINGGYGSVGKTAAQMVDGVFGGASGAHGSNFGRSSPAHWSTPMNGASETDASPNHLQRGTRMAGSSQVYPGTVGYANTNQNIHARAAYSTQSPTKTPLPPPPRGPAGNHRKAD